MHLPVLLHEAIDGLDIKSGDIFVDGTLGGGGHSEEVCKRFATKEGCGVVMIAIDLDPDAISRATSRLSPICESRGCNIRYAEGSFRNLDTILDSLGVARVDKILLDIGLSSSQFEESGRGFSFQKDEPLIMSFKKDLKESDLTAREIVNEWDMENIQAILEGYGEEQFAWKISKAIVERRKVKPIETTFELVGVVRMATPSFYHHKKIHPATKTFQALRIAVNDEIEALKEGISKGFERLNPRGRIAVISFHSLEDRVVKQFFKHKHIKGEATIVTKKPIVAGQEELEANPRARSAKLRIITRLR